MTRLDKPGQARIQRDVSDGTYSAVLTLDDGHGNIAGGYVTPWEPTLAALLASPALVGMEILPGIVDVLCLGLTQSWL